MWIKAYALYYPLKEARPMRVIDPRDFRGSPSKSYPRRKRLSSKVVLLAALCALFVAAWLMWPQPAQAPPQQAFNSTQANQEANHTAATQATAVKQFSGEEFKALYTAIAYPHTLEITTMLPITGNIQADNRIRTLAEQRGYVLRSAALPPLVKVDGYLLQEKAVQPWKDLKARAAQDGIRLGLTSGFRSVEEQRSIFLGRLPASAATIASGAADSAVDATLRMTAPPGYSRHHTGYTIDIECLSSRLVIFERSACFEWLSQNNYEHAKEFGWVPSYPKGTNQQGPEPEAWEYVWVGRNALAQ